MNQQQIEDALDALFVPNNSGAISETEVKDLLKEIMNYARPYKSLVFKFEQSGTDAPNLEILLDDFGVDLVFTRVNVGYFRITSPSGGIFPTGRTMIIPPAINSANMGNDYIEFSCFTNNSQMLTIAANHWNGEWNRVDSPNEYVANQDLVFEIRVY